MTQSFSNRIKTPGRLMKAREYTEEQIIAVHKEVEAYDKVINRRTR